MSDKELVMRKLKGLLETKTNKTITEEMLDCFLDAFSGYRPSEILEGIRKCAQTETYGNISPAEILVHLRPSEDQLDILATEAIGWLERAIVNENTAHIEHDPILKYIVSLGGGLERLAEMSQSSFTFYLKNQKAEYIALMNSPDAMKAIELKQGSPIMIQDMMKNITPKELKA